MMLGNVSGGGAYGLTIPPDLLGNCTSWYRVGQLDVVEDAGETLFYSEDI